MKTKNEHINLKDEDSIDIIALLSIIIKSRKFILKCMSVFFVLGVIIAILSPVNYSASTVFVPQASGDVKAPSGLSGLASLAGININSSSQSNDISPMLYPNLSSNIPFKLNLLQQPLKSQKSEVNDLAAYLKRQNSGLNIFGVLKKYTIGLPSLLFHKEVSSIPSKSNLIALSKDQQELIETLSEKYTVTINEKEGYVAVSALDKNPMVAAELVQIVTANLQNEIIQKRLEKVQNNLDFTQSQYDEKKSEFERVQDRLARFKDRNQNISSSLFLNELERIQAEYSIALNVVTELATQVESAKLQVNKDTPIFSVIDPVTVPTRRDSPKRTLIVTIWLFLGVVLSVGFVLVKQPVIEVWNEILKKQ